MPAINPKSGLLIINLGSPKALDLESVKSYLTEFLMDPYVIDVPVWLRWILVKWLIVPSRSPKTLEAYQSVWTDQGSALIQITQAFAKSLKGHTKARIGVAMRYQEPSIESGIRDLLDAGVDAIYLAPMYPHYAMASTKTVTQKCQEVLKKWGVQLPVYTLSPFYQDPHYIQSLATSVLPHLTGDWDFLLCSYHGVPVRHLKKADPTQKHCWIQKNCCETPCQEAWAHCYNHQLKVTTKLLQKQLNIPDSKIGISYQSRLGADEWLKPPTTEELERLAKSGVKHIKVICPAFVADCLETLEEIAKEAKEIFIQAGGESFECIPCLNDESYWVDAFSKMILSPGAFEPLR